MKKKICPREETSSDINDLPEDILVHIISFIPLEDAVRTSAVARSWRNLWRYVPKLSFDIRTFGPRIRHISPSEGRHLSTDFITNTLNHRQHYNLPLQSFKLICEHENDESTQSRVNSWLPSLIAAKVVEVDLAFCYLFTKELFDFDSTHFFNLVNSSVGVFKMRGIRFTFPKHEGLPLRLESIREVHLTEFDSTNKDIAVMLASCVHLESLSFAKGRGLENLKIVSQQLQHLKLDRFSRNISVEICAPSLISIEVNCVDIIKLSFKRSVSLVEAKVIQEGLSRDLFENWIHILSGLSGVKHLNLQTIWSYRRMDCRKDVTSIVFQVPRLRLVEMKSFRATDDEMCVVELLKKHGTVLEKIVAYPHWITGESQSRPFVL